MKLKREDSGAPTLWGQVTEESNQLILDQSSLKSLHFPRKSPEKQHISSKSESHDPGLGEIEEQGCSFLSGRIEMNRMCI